MDKTYIKMLEGAVKEIQEKWKPKNGDIVWHPNEGADYLGNWEFPETLDIVKLSEMEEDWWCNWLWLPRQEDLQEMLEKTLGKKLKESNRYTHVYREHPEGYLISCVLWEFYQWEDKERGYRLFSSWEQFWLAFVMKENFQKQWNNDKEKWEIKGE